MNHSNENDKLKNSYSRLSKWRGIKKTVTRDIQDCLKVASNVGLDLERNELTRTISKPMFVPTNGSPNINDTINSKCNNEEIQLNDSPYSERCPISEIQPSPPTQEMDILNQDSTELDDSMSNVTFSDSSSDNGISLHENTSANTSNRPQADSLKDELRNWAISYGIKLDALSGLLSLLNIYHPSLPKDSRTLLQTPKQIEVKTIAGGSYYHFGITNCLNNSKKLLDYLLQQSNEVSYIHLQINIDGLPLFKSSCIQFWPILGRVCKPLELDPFLIGLYCGATKPLNVDEYLADFINEMQMLEQKVIYLDFDNQNLPVYISISCFICDAPARAFVKKTKSHSGYWGCDKCCQKGQWDNKVVFPEVNSQLRSDRSFREMVDTNHQNQGVSSLSLLSVGMVTQFPLDYMHLVCLGVTKRILLLWLKSPVSRGFKLGTQSIGMISENLSLLKDFIPREFSRKCRQLHEIERWKATEFRQFLLYTGIVALKGNIDKLLYDHFLLLFVGIYCLTNPELCKSHVDYAHSLLCMFVSESGKIYGNDFLVYNVHCLTHLAEDVKNYGPLDSFSAFPFENFLGKLKKLVHKPQSPLEQVVNRVSERIKSEMYSTSKSLNNLLPKKEHHCGPLPIRLQCKQFAQVNFKGLFFSINNGDNCVKINSHIFLIRNILVIEDALEPVLIVERFLKTYDFFEYPLKSSLLNIMGASKLSGDLETYEINKVTKKYVVFPYKSAYVLLPLNHKELMYYLLETIEDGSKMVTVVPEEWLLDSDSKQFVWPNKQHAGTAWVRMHKKPCSDWQICSYTKILQSSASYEKIRRMEVKAMDESDVFSSLSETEPHRLSRPTRRWSPGGMESDSSESSIPPKKALEPKSRPPLASLSRSLPPAPTPPSESEPTQFGSLAKGHNTSGFFAGASDPSLQFIQNLAKLNLEKSVPFFERILSKVEQLSLEVKTLSRKIDKLDAKLKATENVTENQNFLPSLPEGFQFPLTQVEELDELNSVLADPPIKQKMVLYLANQGGKNAKNALYRIMKMLFSTVLSIKYSFHGKKGKLKFSEKSNIIVTIFDAIMTKYTITFRELEIFTGDWLATSADRSGGRQRRKQNLNLPVTCSETSN